MNATDMKKSAVGILRECIQALKPVGAEEARHALENFVDCYIEVIQYNRYFSKSADYWFLFYQMTKAVPHLVFERDAIRRMIQFFGTDDDDEEEVETEEDSEDSDDSRRLEFEEFHEFHDRELNAVRREARREHVVVVFKLNLRDMWKSICHLLEFCNCDRSQLSLFSGDVDRFGRILKNLALNPGSQNAICNLFKTLARADDRFCKNIGASLVETMRSCNVTKEFARFEHIFVEVLLDLPNDSKVKLP